MYLLKQSTAITVPFFVHDINGDAVTGLTDGSFTKRISKGSGAFAAMTVTITEAENGWYTIPLSTDHSDTLGILSITFTNAGAKQVNLQWRVEAKLNDDLNDLGGTAQTADHTAGIAAIFADTDIAIPAQISGLNDLSFTDIWTGSLTESYAANGAVLTPAQAFYMIWSDLRSPKQVGTTWTDFEIDGTTVSMTFTLDDATTPTIKARAT